MPGHNHLANALALGTAKANPDGRIAWQVLSKAHGAQADAWLGLDANAKIGLFTDETLTTAAETWTKD
jgi:hypothetical protein